MNTIILKGILKDPHFSHSIEGVNFSKAKLITKRASGQEDVINIQFKSFSLTNKENDEITISGNIRSYSEKVNESKNRVTIYVFTYFDQPQDTAVNNSATIDGRICKTNGLRENRNGKHNLHFILANNLHIAEGKKRLNSYIPCIAWGKIAKELATLPVSTKLQLSGELHSREHKKVHDNGEVEFRVAHELMVTEYKVIE